MYHYGANYIFDGYKLLKNAYVSVNDAGVITHVSKANEALAERQSMSFYNGIICPSFVNAHCHLELSDINIDYYSIHGLTEFISEVISKRSILKDSNKIKLWDRIMYDNGISAVGDIVNTEISIKAKQNSKIYYKNFVEISGVNPNKAEDRLKHGINIKEKFLENSLNAEIALHSFYSISQKLLNTFIENISGDVSSIHFFESDEETDLFNNRKGNLFSFLKNIYSDYKLVCNSIYELKTELIRFEFDRVVLIHNTFLKQKLEIPNSKIYYCLCPLSNMNLHNKLPYQEFVNSIKNEFVVGTDSLASNKNLCILSELKVLQDEYDFLDMEDLLKAACKNGADALGLSNSFGSFEKGKKPGLNLIENLDLLNLQLTEKTSVKRII